jgi:hypothetical protein
MNRIFPALLLLGWIMTTDLGAQKIFTKGDYVSLSEQGKKPQTWSGGGLRLTAERSKLAVTASAQLGPDRLLQVVLPTGLSSKDLERRLRVSVIFPGAESPCEDQPGLPRAASFQAFSQVGLPGGGLLIYQGTLRSAEGRLLQIRLQVRIPPTQQAPERRPFRFFGSF